MCLGDQMRSVVSGFEGIATAHVTYLTGCTRFLLTPSVDGNGKMRDSEWVDVEELTVVKAAAVQLPSRPSGGGPNPPKR